MKLKNLVFFIAVCLITLLLCFSAYAAETEGIFTYTVKDNAATVTAVNWEGLEEIVIPEKLGGYDVTTLGGNIMTDTTYEFGDNSVTSLFIPKTVTKINTNTFNFSDLRCIFVDEENPNYSSDKYGVLFNKNKTVLVRAAYSFNTAVYTVPDTVEKIGQSAFNSSLFVEEIIIPDNVTEIGDQAFFQALNLKHVRLPAHIKLIEQNCFARCSSLEEIFIPAEVVTIKNSSFTECDALEKVIISEGVTTIEGVAFESDFSLKYVYLPSTVQKIDGGVFGNCTALTDICYAGTESEWSEIAITKGSYYGDRPNQIDTAKVHYEIPSTDYENIDFSCENGLLTVYGKGSTPSNSGSKWHYWDTEKEAVTAVFIDGDIDKIGAYSFCDFPSLSTLIIRTDSIDIEPYAFSNCPLLENVLIFGDSNFVSDSFSGCSDSIRVFEENGKTHTFNLSSTSINVVKFAFDGKNLNFYGGLYLNAYEFFDTLSVFCLEYENVEKITFTSFSFENIALYYYTDENLTERKRIEENTLSNGEIYPCIIEDGEEKSITFNRLCEGIADKTITNFTLIAKDDKHNNIADTNIEIQNAIGFILKALRWVVTLMNKLFTLLSKIF